MDREVAAVIAMNRLMGDLYCLLQVLTRLGVSSSLSVGIDSMEDLAFIHFRNKIDGLFLEQQDGPATLPTADDDSKDR